MTPPSNSPRPPKPRAATPAERGEEFAEAQRRLKAEAAERRLQAANRPADTRRTARPTGRRGRG
jgi:hypothetical protein